MDAKDPSLDVGRFEIGGYFLHKSWIEIACPELKNWKELADKIPLSSFSWGLIISYLYGSNSLKSKIGDNFLDKQTFLKCLCDCIVFAEKFNLAHFGQLLEKQLRKELTKEELTLEILKYTGYENYKYPSTTPRDIAIQICLLNKWKPTTVEFDFYPREVERIFLGTAKLGLLAKNEISFHPFDLNMEKYWISFSQREIKFEGKTPVFVHSLIARRSKALSNLINILIDKSKYKSNTDTIYVTSFHWDQNLREALEHFIYYLYHDEMAASFTPYIANLIKKNETFFGLSEFPHLMELCSIDFRKEEPTLENCIPELLSLGFLQKCDRQEGYNKFLQFAAMNLDKVSQIDAWEKLDDKLVIEILMRKILLLETKSK